MRYACRKLHDHWLLVPHALLPAVPGAADSIDGGQRPGHRRPMILGPCDL